MNQGRSRSAQNLCGLCDLKRQRFGRGLQQAVTRGRVCALPVVDTVGAAAGHGGGHGLDQAGFNGRAAEADDAGYAAHSAKAFGQMFYQGLGVGLAGEHPGELCLHLLRQLVHAGLPRHLRQQPTGGFTALIEFGLVTLRRLAQPLWRQGLRQEGALALALAGVFGGPGPLAQLGPLKGEFELLAGFQL